MELLVKKTWVRNKQTVLLCGTCEECGRELLSNEGGWTISYNNKKYYCHDGMNGSCYDNYCERKLKEQKYADGRKEKIPLHKEG